MYTNPPPGRSPPKYFDRNTLKRLEYPVKETMRVAIFDDSQGKFSLGTFVFPPTPAPDQCDKATPSFGTMDVLVRVDFIRFDVEKDRERFAIGNEREAMGVVVRIGAEVKIPQAGTRVVFDLSGKTAFPDREDEPGKLVLQQYLALPASFCCRINGDVSIDSALTIRTENKFERLQFSKLSVELEDLNELDLASLNDGITRVHVRLFPGSPNQRKI